MVSKKDHGTFRDFLWHLLHAKDTALTDLEAARAIFLWLCSKDLTQLKFESAEEGSPEQDLLNLRDRKTTYATVFSTLCSYAGLHCQTIYGYAKGAEYQPGDKLVDKQGHHAWNAVYIDGVWRLVDCHWASRRLVGKDVSVDNVRYKMDEYYFMPDPSELRYTHFPEDEKWQLLEKSITHSEFEDLVLLKSNFFKHGLEVESNSKAVNEANNGLIAIKVRKDHTKNLTFTFTLCFDNGKEEFKGTKLARFAMLEVVGDICILNIRLPQTDVYRLTMFAKDQSDTSGVYGAICEYKLICNTPPAPGHEPFPPCVHTSWGPGDEVLKYNLIPLQDWAIFHTKRGKIELKFRIPKFYRFTSKLRNNNVDASTLQNFVLNRVVDNEAIFTMYAPDSGEYGLEIYANDPEIDGNSLSHVYQYLIICDEEVGSIAAHPHLSISFLGQQSGFKEMGLSTDSYPDPFIQADQNDLNISFNTTQPLKVTSQLFYVLNNMDEDSCSDYILQQNQPSKVIFQLKLPDIGWYKFQIYALPVSDTGESFPLIYNYIIRCTSTSTSSPIHFPKQYGLWKNGCYLHTPQQGQLLADNGNAPNIVPFRLSVPSVYAVAVVIGEEWTPLEKGTNTDGSIWEGLVPIGDHWSKETKAMVYANCDDTNPSYSALLEYSM